MRVWRIPLRCLDNRRLLGQHQEIHMLWTVLHNLHDNGRQSGWSNGPQAQPWLHARSAVIDYHDNLIIARTST